MQHRDHLRTDHGRRQRSSNSHGVVEETDSTAKLNLTGATSVPVVYYPASTADCTNRGGTFTVLTAPANVTAPAELWQCALDDGEASYGVLQNDCQTDIFALPNYRPNGGVFLAGGGVYTCDAG